MSRRRIRPGWRARAAARPSTAPAGCRRPLDATAWCGGGCRRLPARLDRLLRGCQMAILTDPPGPCITSRAHYPGKVAPTAPIIDSQRASPDGHRMRPLMRVTGYCRERKPAWNGHSAISTGPGKVRRRRTGLAVRGDRRPRAKPARCGPVTARAHEVRKTRGELVLKAHSKRRDLSSMLSAQTGWGL